MKKLVVNKSVVRRLKIIRDDIEGFGLSQHCPRWEGKAYPKNCPVCREQFPKDSGYWLSGCPCSRYTPKYLIKRLTHIINDSERG